MRRLPSENRQKKSWARVGSVISAGARFLGEPRRPRARGVGLQVRGALVASASAPARARGGCWEEGRGAAGSRGGRAAVPHLQLGSGPAVRGKVSEAATGHGRWCPRRPREARVQWPTPGRGDAFLGARRRLCTGPQGDSFGSRHTDVHTDDAPREDRLPEPRAARLGGPVTESGEPSGRNKNERRRGDSKRRARPRSTRRANSGRRRQPRRGGQRGRCASEVSARCPSTAKHRQPGAAGGRANSRTRHGQWPRGPGGRPASAPAAAPARSGEEPRRRRRPAPRRAPGRTPTPAGSLRARHGRRFSRTPGGGGSEV